MNYKERLKSLGKAIKSGGIQGFIIPMNDEYQNEYVPESARRIEWLTGFSGSAGTVVVLQNKAAIFIDGRYILQAKNQVGPEYERHNIKDLSIAAWIKNNLKSGAVGYDPWLFSEGAAKRMEAALGKIKLAPTENLIDRIWLDRPAPPNSEIMIHPLKYAGKSSLEKRQKISEILEKNAADSCVITLADSICWLLNIRGNDLEYTPLALCFAIIHKNAKVDLYMNPARASMGIREYFGTEIQPKNIKDLAKDLAKLKNKSVMLDEEKTSRWFFEKLKGAKIINHPDPCILPKARKNLTEIKGARAAHIRDGVAVVKFLHWLSENIARGKIDEISASDKLEEFRRQNEYFHSLSFPTISGFAANGAIVHYRSAEATKKTLKGNDLYLLDSGAQYFDGTTDITRTIAIGKPSKEQKENFTRVLKGHIGLAKAKFPEGTTGAELDALARQHLWQKGLDFDHGTGHGVGSFLSVHEGPQNISKRGAQALLPGMIISNEPGFYKEGKYGIRIENLVLVRKAKTSGARQFYEFETLTKVPIDINLIEKSMLDAEERNWLNSYHKNVFMELSPYLNSSQIMWLKKATIAI